MKHSAQRHHSFRDPLLGEWPHHHVMRLLKGVRFVWLIHGSVEIDDRFRAGEHRPHAEDVRQMAHEVDGAVIEAEALQSGERKLIIGPAAGRWAGNVCRADGDGFGEKSVVAVYAGDNGVTIVGGGRA